MDDPRRHFFNGSHSGLQTGRAEEARYCAVWSGPVRSGTVAEFVLHVSAVLRPCAQALANETRYVLALFMREDLASPNAVLCTWCATSVHRLPMRCKYGLLVKMVVPS